MEGYYIVYYCWFWNIIGSLKYVVLVYGEDVWIWLLYSKVNGIWLLVEYIEIKE